MEAGTLHRSGNVRTGTVSGSPTLGHRDQGFDQDL